MLWHEEKVSMTSIPSRLTLPKLHLATFKIIFYLIVSQVPSVTLIIELSYLHLSNSSMSWFTVKCLSSNPRLCVWTASCQLFTGLTTALALKHKGRETHNYGGLSNSLNTLFKEMKRDQLGEFVCGYWGSKG